MDLSAIIFVVLALAWAVYLIPKALKHHDEMASDRLVEGHSDKVRILSRHGRTAVTTSVTTAAADDDSLETVVEVTHADAASSDDRLVDASADGQPATGSAAEPTTSPVAAPVARPRTTRAAARRAAQRRRRVLGLLLVSLATVAGLAWFAIVPWWSTAIPGGLVLLFLVVARVSVRRTQRARIAAPRTSVPLERVAAAMAAPVATSAGSNATTAVPADSTEALIGRLTDEDTVGLQREEIEAALADDGSLWDPLPMTLPTYVNKARARRTVRTIELTGINSAGHDESDTAIAREAAESEGASRDAEDRQRKVVGG